ncbi:MAG: hypothetical protein LBQ78_04350 [Tannerellaceae bacterium]|jgi:hypothetical protein|nr:hypothetical protein [Tannerellaceae bacterium]
MLEFISVPLIIGIISAGIYGIFELLICKKERLAMIEKIGEKVDPSVFDGRLKRFPGSFSFSSLKIGSLLAGIGLGILSGFIISTVLVSNNILADADHWQQREAIASAYGASVLLFGGIALIISFIIEKKLSD